MAIKYKLDIIKALKDAGYSSYRMRQEKTFGQSILTAFRKGEAITWVTLDSLCKILHCQPGDILEYVEDEAGSEQASAEKDTPEGRTSRIVSCLEIEKNAINRVLVSPICE